MARYPCMAEEVNNSGASSSDGQDGVIDLENLVRDIDSTDGGTSSPQNVTPAPVSSRLAKSEEVADAPQPSPKIQTPTKVEHVTPPAVESNIASPVEGAISEDQLDAVLMLESPELAIEMAAIRDVAKSAATADSSTALDGDSSISEAAGRLTLRQRLGFQFLKVVSALRNFKDFCNRAIHDSKGLFRELLIQTKVSAINSFQLRKKQVGTAFAWFKSRTWQQRLSIVLAIAVISALLFVILKMTQGRLLPKTEREWIASFDEKADGVFTYERTDPFEDFNDPILHPEFVVVIDRVIVNLARTPEAEIGSNPMAAFEFYIQTDNQDSAIEVKDRNVAVRDVLARAVERMTYPELATEEGKQKLKLILRKDLNQIMTKGRVRRVYLKTIVLNPE